MSDLPPSTASDSRFAYWTCQLGGWALYTLPRIYAAISVLQLSWLRATTEAVLLSGAGLGLTHWLRNYMSHHQWSGLPIRRLWWRIIVAGFVLGVPVGLATPFTAISALQDPGPLFQGPNGPIHNAWLTAAIFSLSIANWGLLFMIWLAIYFAAITMRRHRRAELRQSELARALQQAELRLLKAQLNPHFLFNALNTVRSLIADEPLRAQRAVTHLANTLRYALRSDQHELVTLAQE
ncbi:MAG: sensor histidine kinase, partial [Terracidiphilus sp.]